jgi:hypothetical protein
MTKSDYNKYLHSKEWADFKARYRASNRPQGCYICGGKPDAIHHLCYDRVGHELLEDCCAVCAADHFLIHFAHDTRATYRQTISSVTESVKAMYQACERDGTTDDFAEIVKTFYEQRRRYNKPRVTIGQIVSLAA